jgi:hypothetical protein
MKTANRIGSTLLKGSFLKKFETTVKYITMFQINKSNDLPFLSPISKSHENTKLFI